MSRLTFTSEGVYAVSTTNLAKELPSAFFRVLGTIFSVAVVLLWIVVASGTLYKAWTGAMFFAPCLKELDDEKSGSEVERTDMCRGEVDKQR